MKPSLASKIGARFETLIAAIDGAQDAWEEYAGKCSGQCEDMDCSNLQMTKLRERCEGVMFMVEEALPADTTAAHNR